MEKICKHCKNTFHKSKFHPTQSYCTNTECQRARRTKWQNHKLKNDSAYKENQQKAARVWRKKNPAYYKEYRQKHESYTEKNRKSSNERYIQNKKKDGALASPFPPGRIFANMDVAPSQLPLKSGRYKIQCLSGDFFANMDSAIVQLIEIKEDVH
jgi:hypothetical protein